MAKVRVWQSCFQAEAKLTMACTEMFVVSSLPLVDQVNLLNDRKTPGKEFHVAEQCLCTNRRLNNMNVQGRQIPLTVDRPHRQ